MKTKVSACNVLAQLAQSRGRSLDWFERANELIKRNIGKDPSLGTLAGAVSVLKQRICGEGVMRG